MPNGLWLKCDSCGEIIYKKQLSQNSYVCSKCDFHFKIRSRDYIDLILDAKSFHETEANLTSVDFLEFKDNKRYSDRLKDARKKTGLKEASTKEG